MDQDGLGGATLGGQTKVVLCESVKLFQSIAMLLLGVDVARVRGVTWVASKLKVALHELSHILTLHTHVIDLPYMVHLSYI